MADRHRRFLDDIERASDERLACSLDWLDFFPWLSVFGRWQRRAIDSELDFRNG